MDAFREAIPGIALVWITVMAAMPADRIVGRSRHGRARSAIAYLTGFGAGLATTVALGGIVASMSEDSAELGTLGLLGSFLGPFVGIGRASWRRPARRSRTSSDLVAEGAAYVSDDRAQASGAQGQTCRWRKCSLFFAKRGSSSPPRFLQLFSARAGGSWPPAVPHAVVQLSRGYLEVQLPKRRHRGTRLSGRVETVALLQRHYIRDGSACRCLEAQSAIAGAGLPQLLDRGARIATYQVALKSGIGRHVTDFNRFSIQHSSCWLANGTAAVREPLSSFRKGAFLIATDAGVPACNGPQPEFAKPIG